MAFKPFDLTGKTVLITGGNGGIGLGMAEGVAQAGADVVIWGTNPDKNAAALKELEQYGTKVAAMKVNVGSEAEVEDHFAKTLDFLGGKLDACFANAGVSGDRRKMKEGFGGMDYAEWRRVLDINLDGVFFTLRAAARLGLPAPEGGTFLFFDVAQHLDARGLPGFLTDLADQGLFLAPGPSFGPFPTHIRLCFTAAPPDSVLRAVDLLASLLETSRKN